MKGSNLMGKHSPTNLDNYIQKAFFGLISIVACFIANEFRTMSVAIRELNEKMVVVVSKVADQEHVNEVFDSRIRAIETKGKK